MLLAAKQHGVTVGTVSQRRFYPAALRVRQAIEQGKIGKPILGTVTMLGWRDEAYYRSDPWRGSWRGEGGGVLVNQAAHQIDLLQWYMGPVDEVFGFWANLNHAYIEVEDTAVAVIRFRNGALETSGEQRAKPCAVRESARPRGWASVGVQTDGGAMFIAGMSTITEPPINDLWTVKGEEHLLEKWQAEDTAFFAQIDPMVYFHARQIEDFLRAITDGTRPLVDGEEGRKTVEIFTAIYRSNRDRRPVKFPLEPEDGEDFDGRLKPQ